jgi:hypothetical protein
MQFNFRELSREDRVALRLDADWCIRVLAACKTLASRMAADAGIFTLLDEEDERALQDFHWVADAHTGDEHEGLFEQRYKQAGLLHSDVGLLSGRIQALFLAYEPILAQSELIDLSKQ